MNVNDHGHVRGNGHDYANGICNGNCHNNGSGTGQRIGNVNGNDNGKRKCNGKGYGDVTSRSRRIIICNATPRLHDCNFIFTVNIMIKWL